MRRILGYTGNDSSLTRHVMAQIAADLAPAAEGESRSWGIGYEQESQVLVRKYPEAWQAVDLVSMATDLRTPAFVAFSSSEPERQRRSEYTEPFRMRSWLGVSVGTFAGVGAGQLGVPEGLGELARDAPMGQRVFMTFLGALRQEGVSLHDPAPRVERLCAAMARTIVEIEAAGRRGGVEGSLDSALMLTNGRSLVVGSLGAEVRVLRFAGIEVEREVDVEVAGRPQRRRTRSWPHLRACVVATGCAPSPAEPKKCPP